MRVRVSQPVTPDALDEIVTNVEQSSTVTQIVEVGDEWWIVYEPRRAATKAKQVRA